MQEIKSCKNANNEGEEELPGVEEMGRCWSGCFAGGAAVEAGGGVVAHGRRLQTVMLLLQAVEKKGCCSSLLLRSLPPLLLRFLSPLVCFVPLLFFFWFAFPVL
jgi:hypothetical protein